MFLESSRHNWHCSPPHPRQVLSMHFETHVEMVLVSSRQSWHCSPPQPRHWLSMQSLTVSAALPTSNANRKRRDILRCSGWRAKSERRGQNHLSQCYSYINRFSTSKPNFHEFSTWQINMKTASSTASRSHKSLGASGASSSPIPRPMAWGPDSGSMPSSSQNDRSTGRTWTLRNMATGHHKFEQKITMGYFSKNL